jgi:hypothetical protein
MERYAIFFPQFHQVKVNDDAWGHGFTDWSLVSTANAFDYWKRRSPVAGFYNLSNTDDVAARFDEAASAGLDGFGIYHYWFDDGSELDAIERYLQRSHVPKNFKYFFIWANENWSKRWAGKDTEILKNVSTSPSREQIRKHVKYLKPFMESESYTKVSNRPLFVIYRPEFFRDPIQTVNYYRAEFDRVSVNPLIGYFIKSASDVEYSNTFDFCYMFEPRLFFNFSGLRKNKFVHSVYRRILQSMDYSKVEYWSEKIGNLFRKASKTNSFQSFIEYYQSTERKCLLESILCPVQNVITCGWNNAPRYRDRFTALEVPNQIQFLQILSMSLDDSRCSENIPLLCNAWNEWSEGAAIEPCQYLGDSLLKTYLSQNQRSKETILG